MDLPGLAISDFFYETGSSRLWVYDQFGPKVEMNIATYFRDWDSMPELEKIALQECGSKVLDVGAGAGSHALALQHLKKQVTALDISPKNAEVMQARGVKKVIQADIFEFKKGRYDTILLLMNGIGLAGNIAGLRKLLGHFKTLLLPGGQLLFDSSDVSYMYEDGILPADHYYGEITCRYGYKRKKTDWFSWLYIDFETLGKTANEEGWKSELLFEDGDDQYLARLTLNDRLLIQ